MLKKIVISKLMKIKVAHSIPGRIRFKVSSLKDIPEEYKALLFPINNKEYELNYFGKMRKEDILSDTDEVNSVPFQVERTIGEVLEDEWRTLKTQR